MTQDEIVEAARALANRTLEYIGGGRPEEWMDCDIEMKALADKVLALTAQPAAPARQGTEADEREAKILVHQYIRAQGETKDADRLDTILDALKWYRKDWGRLVELEAALSQPVDVLTNARKLLGPLHGDLDLCDLKGNRYQQDRPDDAEDDYVVEVGSVRKFHEAIVLLDSALATPPSHPVHTAVTEARITKVMVQAAAKKLCCSRGCQVGAGGTGCVSYQVEELAHAALSAALAPELVEGPAEPARDITINYDRIKGIVLKSIEQARRLDVSDEALARWIAEDLGFAAIPTEPWLPIESAPSGESVILSKRGTSYVVQGYRQADSWRWRHVHSSDELCFVPDVFIQLPSLPGDK